MRAVAALPPVNRELDPDPANASFKGGDRPVESISWYDAIEFCDRLSQHTGTNLYETAAISVKAQSTIQNRKSKIVNPKSLLNPRVDRIGHLLIDSYPIRHNPQNGQV
ncbi:hypothetical protein O77CONTIG1_03815 [Leptolyngbya sp. O-77]|nr:hypothetical protein O77CONTIG1_03815 [Leptolyngbya sp. O-77]